MEERTATGRRGSAGGIAAVVAAGGTVVAWGMTVVAWGMTVFAAGGTVVAEAGRWGSAAGRWGIANRLISAVRCINNGNTSSRCN